MKKILLTLTLSFAVASMHAQEVYSSSGKPVDEKKWGEDDEENKGFDSHNIIFGGGLLLSAGSGYTALGVSPIIGYRLTEKFSAGIGLGYQYISFKPIDFNKKLKGPAYTASVWARYVVFQNIFLQVEPEFNSRDIFFRVYDATTGVVIDYGKERVSSFSLLVGGGLRQPVSDRVSFIGSVMYDVLQDPKSPYYGTLAIRFGIAAGF